MIPFQFQMNQFHLANKNNLFVGGTKVASSAYYNDCRLYFNPFLRRGPFPFEHSTFT